MSWGATAVIAWFTNEYPSRKQMRESLSKWGITITPGTNLRAFYRVHALRKIPYMGRRGIPNKERFLRSVRITVRVTRKAKTPAC